MNKLMKKTLLVLVPFALASLAGFNAVGAAEQKAKEEVRCGHCRRNAFKSIAQSFDDMWHRFNMAFERPMVGAKEEFPVFDNQAVKIPEVAINPNKDGRSLVLEVKDLTAKKEDIKIEIDEDEGYADITFPYQESKVLMRIFPTALALEVEKKIIHEKKDEKGTILSSSSYVARNDYVKSFPYRVAISTTQPEYKNGTLTLKLGSRQTKRALPLK